MPAPPLVRVARNEPFAIGQALDLGAAGVIVPMVEDGEQAARAVAACRYAPEGIRSFGALRAARASEPLCLVMIETRAGVERAEEIAATPGLDGIYVGPSDLALTSGCSRRSGSSTRPCWRRSRRVRAACADGRHRRRRALPGRRRTSRRYADRFAMLTAGDRHAAATCGPRCGAALAHAPAR